MLSSDLVISTYSKRRIEEITNHLKKAKSGYLSTAMHELRIPMISVLLEIVENWDSLDQNSRIILNSSSSKYLILPDEISYEEWKRHYSGYKDYLIYFYKDKLYVQNDLMKYARNHPEELNEILDSIDTYITAAINDRQRIISILKTVLPDIIRTLPINEQKNSMLKVDKRIKDEYMKGYPLYLDEISKEENISIIDVTEILNHYITHNRFQGYLIENIFYPELYLDLITEYVQKNQTGKIADIIEEFNIPFEIFNIAMQNKLKYQDNTEDHFSILYGENETEENSYYLLEDKDIKEIILKLNSKSGLSYQSFIRGMTPNIWVKLFKRLGNTFFFYKMHFFSVKGLKKYIKRHDDEFNEILDVIRLQSLLQKNTREKTLEILLELEEFKLTTLEKQIPFMELPELFKVQADDSFEIQENLSGVELPYFCQIESAMITVGTYTFICNDCERKICPSCVHTMRIVGVVKCVHCGGILSKVPTIQIELNVDKVYEMDIERFNDFINDLFTTQGYKIEKIDILNTENANIIIQKNSTKTGLIFRRPEGNKNIKETEMNSLTSNNFFQECNQLMMISTSFFTSNAKRLAKTKQISLWDRNDLSHYLKQYNEYLLNEA